MVLLQICSSVPIIVRRASYGHSSKVLHKLNRFTESRYAEVWLMFYEAMMALLDRVLPKV